ncbi:hypothetical protein ACUL41_17895 [Virgibacillus natechei]
MSVDVLYKQLVQEFEYRLDRILSEKEKVFVQWIATHQSSLNNNESGED